MFDNLYIAKIGTSINVEADLSSIGLLTAEPKNFANVALQSRMTKQVTFMSDDNFNSVDNCIAYCANDYNDWFVVLDNCSNNHTAMILWQGIYYEHELLDHTIMAYWLAAECQRRGIQVYYMMTDTRLPLVDMSKFVHDVQYTNKLPAGHFNDTLTQSERNDAVRFYDNECWLDSSRIIILSQAKRTADFKEALENNTISKNDALAKYHDYYFKTFKDVKYLPLHYLPLWSHSTYNICDRRIDILYTTQSFKYMQQYRKNKFVKYLCNNSILSKFITYVYGKHRIEDVQTLLDHYTENGDTSIVMPALVGPAKFHEMADISASAFTQLCISENDYVRFDLLPNRIFEAIATGTVPLIDSDILSLRVYDDRQIHLALYNFAVNMNCIINNADDLANCVNEVKEIRRECTTYDTRLLHLNSEFSIIIAHGKSHLSYALANLAYKNIEHQTEYVDN